MEEDKDPLRVKVMPPIEVSGGVEVSKTQEAKSTLFLSLQNRTIQLRVQARQEEAEIS